MRARETIAGVSEYVSTDLGDLRIDGRDLLSARERGDATSARIEKRSEEHDGDPGYAAVLTPRRSTR